MSDPAHQGQGVTAPHLLDMGLDPMWAFGKDATTRHADPECTVYAFGMPENMPGADEPRVKWVEMIVCAEFEDHPIYADDEFSPDIRRATDWGYSAYIMDDAGEITEDWGLEPWPAARERLRGLWRNLRPELAAGDDAYRRAVGLIQNPAAIMGRLLRWR